MTDNQLTCLECGKSYSRGKRNARRVSRFCSASCQNTHAARIRREKRGKLDRKQEIPSHEPETEDIPFEQVYLSMLENAGEL